MLIIAVLIGLLLPVLGKARAAAKEVVCGSRARQVHVALMMYADVSKGCIPRESTMGTTPQDLRSRLPWNVALRPFLDSRVGPDADLNDLFENAPYYRCPSRVGGAHRVHFVANGFAFRAPGEPDERGEFDPSFRRGPSPMHLIPRPAAMLYLTDLNRDEGDVMFGVWRALGDTDLSIGQCYDAWLRRHVTPRSTDFRIGPWCHGDGATGMFLDGHVVHQRAEYFVDVNSWDDGWYVRE